MRVVPHRVALLSGGLDSTVLVAHLLDCGHTVDVVSIDYGQRHARELRSAAAVARHYGLRHDVVDLASVGRLLAGNALTDRDVEVPHGHYEDETMRATVVPNRNAIMLAVAAGIAGARGATGVAIAAHAGDHPVYPDCRPEFIAALNTAFRCGTEGAGDVGVVAPFVGIDKTAIARRGRDLGAPLHLTWSCYEGGDCHCGRCGTCRERAEAFLEAGMPDPTEYACAPA